MAISSLSSSLTASLSSHRPPDIILSSKKHLSNNVPAHPPPRHPPLPLRDVRAVQISIWKRFGILGLFRLRCVLGGQDRCHAFACEVARNRRRRVDRTPRSAASNLLRSEAAQTVWDQGARVCFPVAGGDQEDGTSPTRRTSRCRQYVTRWLTSWLIGYSRVQIARRRQ